jgi:hypothetical protein
MRFIFSFPFGGGWGEDGMGHMGVLHFCPLPQGKEKSTITVLRRRRRQNTHGTTDA